jgi:hypothetical protein
VVTPPAKAHVPTNFAAQLAGGAAEADVGPATSITAAIAKLKLDTRIVAPLLTELQKPIIGCLRP